MTLYHAVPWADLVLGSRQMLLVKTSLDLFLNCPLTAISLKLERYCGEKPKALSNELSFCISMALDCGGRRRKYYVI